MLGYFFAIIFPSLISYDRHFEKEHVGIRWKFRLYVIPFFVFLAPNMHRQKCGEKREKSSWYSVVPRGIIMYFYFLLLCLTKDL